MAVAIKGTKALEAPKKDTVVSTYVSGAPVAPAAGHIAVYMDLATTDEHRAVEIATKLRTLVDRAREEDYDRITASIVYYRCPLNGSKKDIESTTTSTDIIQGDVAIGISSSIGSGGKGSILLDACIDDIVKKMWEQWGSADAAPEVAVNTGGSVEKGDILTITSAMLRSTDARILDDDLVYAVTTGPANGQMEYIDDPGTEITSFTQADINADNVGYAHDDSETASGDFEFSVSNGYLTLVEQDFVITVTTP